MPAVGESYAILNLPHKSQLETLDRNEVDYVAHATTLATGLALPDDIHAVVQAYWGGPHARFPLLPPSNFNTELIHVMYLLLQRPAHHDTNMASLLYLRAKNLIDVLEASTARTLPLLQARILLAYYEMGHGLIEAAASSVGACSKAGRLMRLSARRGDEDAITAEARRRTWWAIYSLDR